MKIDFHILELNSRQKLFYFACQRIEKWIEEKARVYVHVNNQAEADALDDLLWTYKDDSFIPHALYRPDQPTPILIQIGHEQSCPTSAENQFDAAINLSNHLIPFYSPSLHMIEMVMADPIVQQLARQRYKQYRDHGHELRTIK